MNNNFCLGKKSPQVDSRSLIFSDYSINLPAPLPHCSWLEKTKTWSISLNDQIGDCVVAAIVHSIYLWTCYTKDKPIQIDDATTLRVYEKITGYDPKTGKNDNGMSILDIMKLWSKPNNLLNDTCGAYIQCNPKHHDQIKQVVRLFGSAIVGLNLPINCQQDIGKGKTWWVRSKIGNGKPGSWGEHCVIIVSYDSTGLICVTWGGIQKMTWEFLDIYCDEMWVVINRDWINITKNVAPNGFNWIQLQSDLQAIPNL